MDQAVDALRNCVVDDVHLGIRFADLLETLTSRLRSRFISAPTGPPPHGETSSRNRSPVAHQEPDGKRMKLDQREQVREWNAATPNYNMGNGPDLNVSATPFDLNQGAFFPTPGTPYNPGPGSNYGNDITDVFGGGSDWNGGSEMWYLPPGAAFFQNVNDQGVTQTAEGVNVGGMDLLDFMALDPFPSVDGSGF